MFWVRQAVLMLLLCGLAHAQSNPGFIEGAVLCANTGCSTQQPVNPLGLNQAFMAKQDLNAGLGIGSGVSVVSFGGADPTGAVDATVAFQTTVNKVATNGGGCVLVPVGTFSISGTITFPSLAGLCGSGLGSHIIGTGPSGQVLFSIGDGTTNPKNLVFENVYVSFSQQQSAGSAFRLRNGHNIYLRNILTYGANTYTSIQMETGAINAQYGYFVDHVELDYGSYGIVIGDNVNPTVQEVWINDSIIAGDPAVTPIMQAGISIRNGSGMYGKNVSILKADRGIEIIPTTGQLAKGINFNGYIVDTNASYGLLIAPTASGQVYANQFTGLWAVSTKNGPGISIAAGLQSSNNVFTGCIIAVNGQQGVFLQGGSFTTFSNCHVADNSVLGSAMYPGYEIAANVSYFTIVGGVAGSMPVFGGNNQSYGIKIDNGNSDHFQITGVNFETNVTGPLISGAAGLDIFIVAPHVSELVDNAPMGQSILKLAAPNNTSAGANLQLFGDGATNPAKTVRVHGGVFQIINNAYSAPILSLTDAGALTVTAGIAATLPTTPPSGTGTVNMVCVDTLGNFYAKAACP